MRIKTESFELNGTKYTTTQFAAYRSLELLSKLMKSIGPALGALGGLDPGMDVSKAAPLLISALVHVDASVLAPLAVEVLGQTTALITGANGEPQIVNLGDRSAIDRVFTGGLKDMFMVLGHALKTNYSDFFAESGVPADAPAPLAS